MTTSDWSRRGFAKAGLGLVGAAAFAGAARAQAAPKSPVSLAIVDVAGNLALTKPAIEDYAAANPKLVSHVAFSQAPAPELPAKIKAQQGANRVDIDLVLTGTDALAAGIQEKLWIELLPAHQADLPDLAAIYQPAANNMQSLAQGQGVCVTYYPSGPLFEYMPDRVKKAPATADELLAYSKENKNRFLYARPANSGPGRTLLMGLPYILGDADPKDPVKGWDKTWAFLAALGENIEYYPSGTGITMKELGDGTRDMIAATTGWDINPRALGIVPKEAQVVALQGLHWVGDAHYMCVPKGLPDDRLAVVLDLMRFMLRPKSQAYAYDKGYFYPGPAVKDVTLAMAPQASQDVIKEFGRPEYEAMIASHPIELPLDAASMVTAFKLWDQRIGAAKSKG
ncbi:ABC transporter substrate-binding protein [Methylocapsa sp. S129]|uniref:ABC transporter substrate-binding protein n=1 Tax=Methylocapsa sp. S129 TaxID=1641869 RepID=UPI00131A7274|nr:extracellular solute-binding protein [Methylocapsa sp. S129]